MRQEMPEPEWLQGDDFARGLTWTCPQCEAENHRTATECAGCGYVDQVGAEAEAYWEAVMEERPEDAGA